MSFGITFTCEQAFSSMKLIKRKNRTRLTHSNLKNFLLLSGKKLTPNKQLVKTKTQKFH